MWKIDHAVTRHDGAVDICKLGFVDERGRKKTFQLKTAIRIPPPSPDRGPAITALRQFAEALLDPPESIDVSDIEDELNAGGE